MINLDFFHELIKECPISDIENGPWVAGGYPLSIYRGDNTFKHDIDFFFKDENQLQEYQDKFEKLFYNNHEEVEDDGTCLWNSLVLKENGTSWTKMITVNSITYLPQDGNEKNQVQFVKKNFYTNLQGVLDDFDVSVCKIATDGVDFFATNKTYKQIENSVFDMSCINEKSIRRFTKYVSYGFTPSQETIKKLYEFKGHLFDFAGVDDY